MAAPHLITLHGAGCSLVIECPDGAPPLWRYWGPRLADGFASGSALGETRPLPSFTLDNAPPFELFPTFGLGWCGQSALLAHREGQDFAQRVGAAEVTWIDAQTVRLELRDDVAKLAVALTLALDPLSDVLTVSTTLTNLGEAVLDVQWLASAALPLPDDAAKVRSYSGRHNSEFILCEEPLGRAIWRKENRRGLTSHDAFPGAVVMLPTGTAFGAQLAWSGNHAQSIEWLDDGRYQWQMGVWLAPGEGRLGPGETMTAPDVLATCSTTGAGGVATNFHAAIRHSMTWPGGAMRPRPVHLNTWEGYYFDHDLPALIRLADAAAEVGIERFVLDDGWFHRRDDDRRALGDWWADARKYPDGLAPLATHVVAKGMEFGLWVEPEMVNPDSALFRTHPDWALQIAGRPLMTGRNQLVLDLARAEVSDYLFDSIASLLRTLPIAYLKWDHNRDLATAAGPDSRARYRAQVDAAYALFDRFRAAFPAVEIEACAGGGGRIDAGIIRRTHRFWTSDCIDAVSRVDIQRGFLQFLPPELMGSHIGTAPAHTTGRSQHMDFRAAVALQGHFGVEFDLVKLGDKDRARLAEWIGFYKTWRHLLHAQVWQGEAGDNMVWHAAGSADEWLLIVYRMQPMQHRHMPPVRLPFVAREGLYQVTRIDPSAAGEAMTFDGSWLANAGLPVPPMKAERAVIYRGVRG